MDVVQLGIGFFGIGVASYAIYRYRGESQDREQQGKIHLRLYRHKGEFRP
ncbi:unnamed protein product, partial [marine sediment metagenome]